MNKIKYSVILFASGLFIHGNAQEKEGFKGVIGKTLAESTEYWAPQTKAPEDAPNVIWILLDDVGYGASSAFGGLIRTPVFDNLASQGLRYTNFHTTAICAPTRAALLTGRNHHRVNQGGFSHAWGSFAFPGWEGRIPSDKGTIAEILRENGYNTFAVGKYGLTPDEEASDAGPFDLWPSGKGFEHFFGFLGSQTDQYKPNLVEDNAHVIPDGRHLNEQITDKAIDFIKRQQAANSGKPFFLYYAPGATHAPHQVPDQWRDIYKGEFDKGWDDYRQRVFEQQKKLGTIPSNAQLPDRNPYIKAWNKLSEDEKRLYARYMEVYAAYLTYTDHEVGRLVDYLKGTGQLENTLIFVILGDNGASKEGSDNGRLNTSIFQELSSNEKENIRYNLSNIDLIGKPEGTEVNYPLGWAQAANTPFRFWKTDAHSEGGTRNPLIVYYPNAIKDKGGIRNQYSHVIDLLPTTLEVIGVEAPKEIKGIKQDIIQGTSLAYSINNKTAASRHTVQYYYIFGSTAIYKDGWKATLAYKTKAGDHLFKPYSLSDRDNNDWQLFNMDDDFNERNDLAKKYPEKLEELKQLFDEQAKENNIYPLINWDDVFNKGARLKEANASQLRH